MLQNNSYVGISDSANLTCHGLTTSGKQGYLCHDCRYSRNEPQPNGYTESERETILPPTRNGAV